MSESLIKAIEEYLLDWAAPRPDETYFQLEHEVRDGLAEYLAKRLEGGHFLGSLEEACQFVETHHRKGVRCPCCGQHAQVYTWSLYATAARALILYYRLGNDGTSYVHINSLKAHGHRGQGDASRLHHWGLVEQESERRPDGGRSGWWRVTPLGKAFVLNKGTIPKYVDVYNGRVLEIYGPEVSIIDGLGRRFHYDQMMSGDFGDDGQPGEE